MMIWYNSVLCTYILIRAILMVYVVVTYVRMGTMYMQERLSSLNRTVMQQSSEILMLKDEHEKLKKDHEQLIGDHNKCKSQKDRNSVAIQTDKVNMVNSCTHIATYISK